MTLQVVYNEQSKQLIDELKSFNSIELISYNEDIFSERKQAFKFKASFSAKKTPFAVIYDDEHKPLAAFYSEVKDCTYDRIEYVLDQLINL